MTEGGLKYLKKLVWEVHELQDKAEGLKTRIQNLYCYEEDVLDRGAYMRLSDACAAMKDAVPCIIDALIGLQKAYKAEKALMDMYDGLLNKLHNDEE